MTPDLLLSERVYIALYARTGLLRALGGGDGPLPGQAYRALAYVHAECESLATQLSVPRGEPS